MFKPYVSITYFNKHSSNVLTKINKRQHVLFIPPNRAFGLFLL